jgi:RHS repeat-associated protein
MVYDAENRLSAIAQAGVMSDEFGYAFDGTRLWKRLNQNPTNIQVWIGNIYEQKEGKALFHLFANGEQVCTFETNSFLYGGTSTNAVGNYYHQDSLTSSSVLSSGSTSDTQTEVNVWYPFGRIQTASPQAAFQVSRRFTGQIFDAESGLYYYNARYYDPELGRFIQPDDIIPDYGNPQTYNRYSYCRNDPLTYSDPSGHDDTYTGASGRAMLQEEDSDAAGVVLRARQSAATTATVLRTAAELNPIVGAANGGIGAVSGNDAITGEKLTTGQRWEAGGSVVLAAVPAVFKVGGKLIKVGEAAAEASTAVRWSSYGGKHVASANIPWAKVVASTLSGAAKYKPGVDIEKLERAVWDAGVPVSNGKPWKVAEFTGDIGASAGKPSRWVRVEESGGTIHGHPITEQEFQKLTKPSE